MLLQPTQPLFHIPDPALPGYHSAFLGTIITKFVHSPFPEIFFHADDLLYVFELRQRQKFILFTSRPVQSSSLIAKNLSFSIISLTNSH
jgi:hypothetical protein